MLGEVENTGFRTPDAAHISLMEKEKKKFRDILHSFRCDTFPCATKHVTVGQGFVLEDLDYADDIAILGENFADIQLAINEMQRFASQLVMKINAGKTKLLTAGFVPTEKQPIVLGGEVLEEVDRFKYLGSILTATGQGKEDIISRIANAQLAFCCLQSRLWSRREIKLATKIRVYQALVRTIYGCESWPMRASDLRRLEVFDHYCLCRILRLRWQHFVSNAVVRERCQITSLQQALLARRLCWFGHALRRQRGELIREAIDPIPLRGWKRRCGGQLKTWLRTVKQDAELNLGPTIYGIRRWNREWLSLVSALATDRRAWSAFVPDAVNSLEGAGLTDPG